MNKKILFIILMTLISKVSTCQDNNWILSCGNPVFFEFFAYSQKDPGILFYGNHHKIDNTAGITIIKLHFTGDSLFYLDFPTCLKFKDIIGDERLKNYSILDSIDISQSDLIGNKDKKLYDFLNIYLTSKHPNAKPLLFEYKKYNKFKKGLGKEFLRAFSILIKECR